MCEQGVANEVHLECPICDDLTETILLRVTNAVMTLTDQFSTLLRHTEIEAELRKCVFRIMENRKCFLNLL